MKNNFEKEKKDLQSYLKYSGLGFQIAGIVAVGVFIGYKLDKWQQTSSPYYTAVFSLLFVFLALYVSLKEFLKQK